MNELSAWLLAQYGPDERYKSARDLSLAADLSTNAVGTIVARGRARPDSLIKLANAVGAKPSFVLALAGLVEKDGAQPDLPPILSEVAEVWDRLPPDAIAMLEPMLAAAVKIGRESDKSSLKVDDAPARYLAGRERASAR